VGVRDGGVGVRAFLVKAALILARARVVAGLKTFLIPVAAFLTAFLARFNGVEWEPEEEEEELEEEEEELEEELGVFVGENCNTRLAEPLPRGGAG